MTFNGKLTGVIGFEAVSEQKNWENEHITRLRTISEIFGKVLVKASGGSIGLD